jgi:RNA polymerase sigma-70 factor (ECF subfamily)
MLEDRILVWELKRGRAWALDRIYAKYLGTLLTVAMGLLGDPQLAEDVVQEVLIQFVESVGGFHLKGSLKGFLATCVANRARNLRRQRYRQEQATLRIEDTPLQGKDPEGPVDVLIRDEKVRSLYQALLQLPPEQREIIVLKTRGGMSFKALALELDISLGTVQSRYRYGMERLRVLLEKEGTA